MKPAEGVSGAAEAPELGRTEGAQPPPATDQVEIGSNLAHDTRAPDIETASDLYASRFDGPIGEWLLRQQSAAVSELLDRTGDFPLRVLEIGGGHGQLTSMLLERGHEVVVQGSAPVCFERLAHVRERYPAQLSFCVSNLWKVPLPTGDFDLVLAVRLLGHVVRWRPLLAEMGRLSKNYVMVEFARAGGPILTPLAPVIFALKRRIEGTTRPFFAYREDVVLRQLQALAFDCVATRAQLALPMVLHRALKMPALSSRLERLLRRAGLGDRMRSPVIVLAQRAMRP